MSHLRPFEVVGEEDVVPVHVGDFGVADAGCEEQGEGGEFGEHGW